MVIPGGGKSCPVKALAMGMYALAITPLIRELSDHQLDTKQVWYANDDTGAGTCSNLKRWWDCLTSIGPKYDYFSKAQNAT